MLSMHTSKSNSMLGTFSDMCPERLSLALLKMFTSAKYFGWNDDTCFPFNKVGKYLHIKGYCQYLSRYGVFPQYSFPKISTLLGSDFGSVGKAVASNTCGQSSKHFTIVNDVRWAIL